MTAHSDTLARWGQSLDGMVDRIESARALDPIADFVAKTVERVLPTGATRDLVSGVPLGHPLHPLLVAVPIGSWSAASWLDLTADDHKQRDGWSPSASPRPCRPPRPARTTG